MKEDEGDLLGWPAPPAALPPVVWHRGGSAFSGGMGFGQSGGGAAPALQALENGDLFGSNGAGADAQARSNEGLLAVVENAKQRM